MKNKNEEHYIILYRRIILTILIGMLVLCICFLLTNIYFNYTYSSNLLEVWTGFTNQDEIEEEEADNPSKRILTDECVPYDGQYREISCWGDSMTLGIGRSAAEIIQDDEVKDISYCDYPSILEELTGIPTHNFGVSGATSEEIAVMQGGLALEECDIDMETSNIDMDIMQESVFHKNDILIIEIGSNGGWENDYEKLILQYDAMILNSNCPYYIIIGDTDDPGTSLGDKNQTEKDEEGYYIGIGDTAWEAVLRKAYGDHFINMRTYLVKYGLSDVHLSATIKDQSDAKKGFVSEQLKSDWTHLNSYGYYAKGLAVYKKGVELGYWR